MSGQMHGLSNWRDSHTKVMEAKAVTEFWEQLGLTEMPHTYDTDCNRSGGLCVSDEFVGEGLNPHLFSPKRPRLL